MKYEAECLSIHHNTVDKWTYPYTTLDLRGTDDRPILRLIQLARQAWPLIWSYHHLLLDGWSGPLLKEVFAFYQAFCQGQELSLAYPRPYSDYIGNEPKMLHGSHQS